MIVSSVAKRYSKALFEIAKERNSLKEILVEFQSFLVFTKKNAEFNFLLGIPNMIQREKILLEFLKERYSDTFVHFILIVLRNKRHLLFPQIFEDFQRKYDTEHNRIRAHAITAIPLTDKKINELQQKISKYTNANIIIENRIDSSIIGGIIIQIDGQIFNASLTEQLIKLKQYLIQNQT